MPTSYTVNLFSVLVMCAFGLMLAACVSGKPDTDTYTSRSGAVTAVETDRESCIRSCNRDYERCGDVLSSTRSDVSNQPTPKPFGVASECKDSLKSCLARCKGR